MIAYLKGTLAKKTPTEILVDVGGVGYSVNVSLSTFAKLPEEKASVYILTHHHIREDAQILFGFITEQEREVFRLLISVSGIGPKMAQTILSGIQSEELMKTISQGNVNSLTTIPGIGKKTAERLVVELRDKFSKMDMGSSTGLTPSTASNRNEALSALQSLGFSRDKAEQAIRFVLNANGETDMSVEDLIKNALKNSGK